MRDTHKSVFTVGAKTEGKDVKTCVPFISEYSDCTPENECSGCTKCACSAKGMWECQPIHKCDVFETDKVDEELLDAAIEKLDSELKAQRIKERLGDPKWKVPAPAKKPETQELLDLMNNNNPERKLKEIMAGMRLKRSTGTKAAENKHQKRSTEKIVKNRHPRNSNNNTVKFYSTVDDLNEDTLRHSNISGTLHARRVELNMLPDISRRSNTIANSNKSLHIDFNQPKEFNHITDNKIDTPDHESKFDISHEKLNIILGNHTQKIKDKTLSKLVVNELKSGSEIIGNNHAPVTSNITFTSENDTLTAMAFIAGNLLNKLWNMEKETSGVSLETEDMKYEKISDLLDLFKEPLNLRQEAFLRNALEQLSHAIDKDRDMKNITICQTIEEASQLIDSYNNTDEEKHPSVTANLHTKCEMTNGSKKDKTGRKATIKAIAKINNVLELMKKFENIQKNISLLKNESALYIKDSNNPKNFANKENVTDNDLTKDEVSSLNVFGNILNKITNLLLPKKSDRRISQTINNRNMLSKNKNNNNNFMKIHNINLANMTVSAKDKIILDYITHINSNPNCILNNKHQSENTQSLPSVEGNILLNLSEFFKMKSFADLINLLKPEKASVKRNIESETTKRSTESSMVIHTTKPTTPSSVDGKNKRFASTKERLKAHLKSIIEDLLELQNSKGIAQKSNIRIAEALPCIYKIMNAGKDIDISNKNSEQEYTPDRIVDIFNALKNTMKVAQTRRNDAVMTVRPKSAVVLERVIKNFVEKSKVQTRRTATIKLSNPVEQLKKVMHKLRNVSSIYKNQALYNEVPAAEKLILLKALAEDLKHNILALEGIKQTYQHYNQLPADQYKQLANFIDNSAANITLDSKVIQKVKKVNVKNRVVDEMDDGNKIFKDALPKKPFGLVSRSQDDDDNMKISRNQIINHLIRNRMKIYMKLKEAKQIDLSSDMNYNIAKRVLFYLDNGNFNLAQELFKMLVMQKHDHGIYTSNDRSSDYSVPAPKMLDFKRQNIIPVMQLDQPTTPSHQMKWMSQDHLIKQLLNIKNMGL